MKEFIYIHPTSSCGMCGYICQIIRAMYHFPNDKYYIELGKECMFYDDSVEHTKNVWEYYFEQPHTKTLPPTDNIIKEVGLLHDEFSEFRDCYMTNLTSDAIEKRRVEYSKIIEKNLILKSSVKEKIDSFYDTHFKGKKVLGIHCRSTDHPDKLNILDCVNMISSLSNQYDLIFASSDDAHQIYQLKDVFGDKLVTYDSLRSMDGSPLHHRHDRRIVGKSNYNHKIGEDVIIESYLLSKTNFLFCTTSSNVNFLVRVINPNLPYIVVNYHRA